MTGNCSYCGQSPVYCKGYCKQCYTRGCNHKRKTGVFDPKPLVPREKHGPCTVCGAKHYAKGLCFNCYRRAHKRQLEGKGFDPTPLPPKVKPGHVLCPSCGRIRKLYAKGVCRTCWNRGSIRRQQGEGFVTAPRLPYTALPEMALSGDTSLDVLRRLRDGQDVDFLRTRLFGVDLARKLGVSRQRIHQILYRLQRKGFLVFRVILSKEARKVLEQVESELVDGQLTLAYEQYGQAEMKKRKRGRPKTFVSKMIDAGKLIEEVK